MSDTVDKVLVYLGEKPRQRAGYAAVRTSVPRKRAGTLRVQSAIGADESHRRTGDALEGRHRAPKLPSTVVARLADKLAVAPEAVLSISDISARTFHRRQANHEPLTEAESDRVLRIARVARDAERVFGDADKASRWLSSESVILGARPLALLATDAGARDVESELIRIEHGDFA